MKKTMKDSNNLECRITLPAALTIETVEAVRTEFVSLQSDKIGKCIVDAGATEVVTTPGIQLLLAMDAHLRRLGGSLGVVNAKESFSKVFESAGLGETFKQWENHND